MFRDLQERAINGFQPLGYTLAADDGIGLWSEFRKPDTSLRFSIRYGEGGVTLFWTENQECSLLDNKPSPGVERKNFCGSPEEFWGAVKGIIEGRTP